ncbi:hypothetical protein ACFSQQ_13650 [Mesorhizobium kowhaii]|uniref:hypothetical protein n=1 Tax=Mesorhizobium kowhaii TaxID=1300272 RepID=UPI0035EDC2DA
MKRLVATCVIGLLAYPALAQHQMSREETIAQVATDVAFIEETLPSYQISNGEVAPEELRENLQKAVTRAMDLRDRLASNPFVRVSGISVGFPAGLTIQLSFPDQAP